MIHAHLSAPAVWSVAAHFGPDLEFSGIDINSCRLSAAVLFVGLIGAHHEGTIILMTRNPIARWLCACHPANAKLTLTALDCR